MTINSTIPKTLNNHGNYYQDPWKEFAYKILERTIKDAKGRDMCLVPSEFNQRRERIKEAREYMKSPAFELLCEGLGVDPKKMRDKVNGNRA